MQIQTKKLSQKILPFFWKGFTTRLSNNAFRVPAHFFSSDASDPNKKISPFVDIEEKSKVLSEQVEEKKVKKERKKREKVDKQALANLLVTKPIDYFSPSGTSENFVHNEVGGQAGTQENIEEGTIVEKPAPKKRGRKPKVIEEEEKGEALQGGVEGENVVVEKPAPKKRGRKPKVVETEIGEEKSEGVQGGVEEAVPKKRGRKPKVVETKSEEEKTEGLQGGVEKESPVEKSDSLAEAEKKPRRGRKKNVDEAPKSPELEKEEKAEDQVVVVEKSVEQLEKQEKPEEPVKQERRSAEEIEKEVKQESQVAAEERSVEQLERVGKPKEQMEQEGESIESLEQEGQSAERVEEEPSSFKRKSKAEKKSPFLSREYYKKIEESLVAKRKESQKRFMLKAKENVNVKEKEKASENVKEKAKKNMREKAKENVKEKAKENAKENRDRSPFLSRKENFPWKRNKGVIDPKQEQQQLESEINENMAIHLSMETIQLDETNPQPEESKQRSKSEEKPGSKVFIRPDKSKSDEIANKAKYGGVRYIEILQIRSVDDMAKFLKKPQNRILSKTEESRVHDKTMEILHALGPKFRQNLDPVLKEFFHKYFASVQRSQDLKAYLGVFQVTIPGKLILEFEKVYSQFLEDLFSKFPNIKSEDVMRIFYNLQRFYSTVMLKPEHNTQIIKILALLEVHVHSFNIQNKSKVLSFMKKSGVYNYRIMDTILHYTEENFQNLSYESLVLILRTSMSGRQVMPFELLYRLRNRFNEVHSTLAPQIIIESLDVFANAKLAFSELLLENIFARLSSETVIKSITISDTLFILNCYRKVKYRDEEFFERCVGKLRKGLSSLKERNIKQLLLTLADLNYQSQEVFDDLYKQFNILSVLQELQTEKGLTTFEKKYFQAVYDSLLERFQERDKQQLEGQTPAVTPENEEQKDDESTLWDEQENNSEIEEANDSLEIETDKKVSEHSDS